MSEDDRVYALTADIGYRNFNKIIDDFPDRFINVGVAEANMIGIAAGLTLSGKIAFVFTIAPFVTMRCLEQIRIDLCYNELPVKIVGAGGGFIYGAQGTTHHVIEEIGILRTLPNMTVICPADPIETEKAVRATMRLNGPAYIRIGRNNEPVITESNYDFQIERGVIIRDGKDVSVITYGPVINNILSVAEKLKKENISVRVINMHTVKPIDVEIIKRCSEETKAILTVEEHNIIGGLGSAVAEILSEVINSKHTRFKRLGLYDKFCTIHASYIDLQEEYGLGVTGIEDSIKNLLV
jgi:transketolase